MIQGVQELVRAMSTLLVAKFALNDVPHALGLTSGFLNARQSLEEPGAVHDELPELRYFASWLSRHQREYALPTRRVLRIAKQMGWLYSGEVYRGITWGEYLYAPYAGPLGVMRIRRKVSLPSEVKPWTKYLDVALAFTVFNRAVPVPSRGWLIGYSKRAGAVGAVLRGRIEDGLDIDKASEELYRRHLALPFPLEGEVLGVVRQAVVVDYVDYRVEGALHAQPVPGVVSR